MFVEHNEEYRKCIMMKKKKVVFFINSLYGGGAEKVLQTLLKHINYDKFDITLYSVNQGILNASYPSNIQYYYVFNSCKPSASIYEKFLVRLKNKVKLWVYEHFSPKVFYRFFIKGKYDTEVAFIEGYATRIVGGSTNSESKKIAWVHIDLEQNHWTGIAYRNFEEEKKVYSLLDIVVSVSSSVNEATQRLLGNIKNPMVLYNPIDTDFIHIQSGKTLSIPQKRNRIRLISVGRYVPQKAFHRLISISARLIKLGYNIELLLLGEGHERPNLENQIQELGLNDYVSLLGFQDNPYPFIKSADLFVCSSLTEGYSTVVTESLILNKPIVTTDCAGMRELLLDGECGLITENNEDALFEGIKKVLDSRKLYDIYVANILKTNVRFNVQNLMNRIENII